jgi:RNA polymerase sigma factor (sigma-70 family)
MEQPELLPHLFRTEYRKIIAVLCKRFGFHEMETAEDIASDTFMTAAQTWGLQGIPPNPVAWLYTVAKNKAGNFLKRQATFHNKVVKETAVPENACTLPEYEIDLSPQNINDSQLQMMFAICHPAIAPEAQIGLSLRILCGFGIEEIANAFLTNKETINKRLHRAKEKLRSENIPIALPDQANLDDRLGAVLATLYLLFSEGYYSISNNKTLRKELCFEAMRLCYMLIENKQTNKPPVNALLSLMCFHASRFEARMNKQGELILYEEQDTSLWDTDLISKGGYFLNLSASGNQLSKYHLEAAIAYWNTQKDDTSEKWENILQLYNRLLQLEYSPMAALNRTFALSKANGKTEAILEAEKLNLTTNHFYFTLLGELYSGMDNGKARGYLEKGLTLAKTQTDKQTIQKKIDRLS